jgi:hypothetical protein
VIRRFFVEQRPSLRAAAAVAAASVLALVVGVGAALPAAPTGGARSLAVSVPPEPISIAAGETGKTLIRVINPNPTPVPVTLSGREVALEDNGQVSIGAGPDPIWSRLGDFPTRELTVPASGYVDVPLTIRTPSQLQPDLYFLGFLVTPRVTTPGDLQVINQIGSFLTIDIPGPRVTELAGRMDAPSFVFGSHATSTVQVSNVGHAAVLFWGEADTSSSPGTSAVTQQRFEPSLLPRGRERTITVTAKPNWPVGMVTMTVQLIYPGRTAATTKELVFSKRVLVIDPIVLFGAALVLGCAAVLVALRVRKRVHGTLN